MKKYLFLLALLICAVPFVAADGDYQTHIQTTENIKTVFPAKATLTDKQGSRTIEISVVNGKVPDSIIEQTDGNGKVIGHNFIFKTPKPYDKDKKYEYQLKQKIFSIEEDDGKRKLTIHNTVYALKE